MQWGGRNGVFHVSARYCRRWRLVDGLMMLFGRRTAVLSNIDALAGVRNSRPGHIGDRDRSGPVEIALAPGRWGNRGRPEYRGRRRCRTVRGICHRDTRVPDIAVLPDLAAQDTRSGSRARHGHLDRNRSPTAAPTRVVLRCFLPGRRGLPNDAASTRRFAQRKAEGPAIGVFPGPGCYS